MLRWFKLGARQVRIPDACDRIVVDGVRYVRRGSKRTSYWVDSRGVEWRSAKQRQRLKRLASWRAASAKRRAVRNT